MKDGFGDGPAPVACKEETYEILPGFRLDGERAKGDGGPGLGGIVPVLLCDHAGNAFPSGYGTLGLTAGQLQRHIAYDIGAAGVVRTMLARLACVGTGSVAVLSRYSRLLVDLNRGEDDPTLIMRLSDGAIVPGNHPIDAGEWERRIRLYYQPYHRAIDAVLDRLTLGGFTPIVISVHSFTPAWKGIERPWHAGILWDRDARLPLRLLQALRDDPDLTIGDNQPYTGKLEGDCLHRHATARGLPNALIEIRQDLIATASGQHVWADRLSGILERMLADPVAVGDLQQMGDTTHIRSMLGR